MQAGSAEDVRKWVLDICADAGLTVTDLAKRAGLSPSTLTRFLNGINEQAMLSGRTLQKLNSIEDRLRREKTSPQASSRPSLFPPARAARPVFDVQAPGLLRLFPLELASSDVSGPEGMDEFEMVRGVSHPDGEPWPIGGDADYRRFTIYMPGEAMRPRFRTGECLIIDGTRHAPVGSDVLIEFVPASGGPTLGTIAELVDSDRGQIRLRQLQHQVVATIHRSRIRTMFPVMGSFSGDMRELGLNFT